MRVGGIPFKVIGTLKSKGSMGPMDQDDLIFIPITTAQKKSFRNCFPGHRFNDCRKRFGS